MDDEMRNRAAVLTGMKTEEITGVTRDGDNWVVTTHDGAWTLVPAPESAPDPEPESPKKRSTQGARRD